MNVFSPFAGVFFEYPATSCALYLAGKKSNGSFGSLSISCRSGVVHRQLAEADVAAAEIDVVRRRRRGEHELRRPAVARIVEHLQQGVAGHADFRKPPDDLGRRQDLACRDDDVVLLHFDTAPL
ncbi:MAG TPA: hypothetical protein VFZ38_00825, partial [Vicinamibacterales bacterium]